MLFFHLGQCLRQATAFGFFGVDSRHVLSLDLNRHSKLLQDHHVHENGLDESQSVGLSKTMVEDLLERSTEYTRHHSNGIGLGNNT